jgi:hypothetical protein
VDGPVLQPPPPAALLSRFGRQHHDALLLKLVKVLKVCWGVLCCAGLCRGVLCWGVLGCAVLECADMLR